MKIDKTAIAGSLESNDCMVTVAPAAEGIVIEVDSIVKKQFGAQIIAAVEQTLQALSVNAAEVRIQDKGAVECTIKARTETAVRRACEEAK